MGQAWQDTGYIFTNEDGEPVKPDAITRAFNAHIEALDVTPIVLHGLCHTHITLSLAAGVPVKVMQERAGNAKIETTLGYAHVQKGMQEQAAETFARLIER
jgi:site-specific recombinase XerD